MKRMVFLLSLAIILAGCSGKSTMETLGNPCLVEPVLEPAEVQIELPEHLAQPVLQNDSEGKLYLSDRYALSVQILASGDVDKTFHNCTGYCIEDLSVIETESNGMDRYDSVCTTAGEGDEQIVRLAVIDDGMFHYVVTAMASEKDAGSCTEEWNNIFSSIQISTDQ